MDVDDLIITSIKPYMDNGEWIYECDCKAKFTKKQLIDMIQSQ